MITSIKRFLIGRTQVQKAFPTQGENMIDRKEIKGIVEGYYANADKIKVGTIASHSGLDICDGAVEEEFRTLAVCQAGREKLTANTSEPSEIIRGE